jgi:hypothetical protein
MQTKKNIPGPADEDVPNLSTTPDYIISKPWKESKIARNWMMDQESDPLFDVRHTSSFAQDSLITLLGFRLEPQEIHLITAARSG